MNEMELENKRLREALRAFEARTNAAEARANAAEARANAEHIRADAERARADEIAGILEKERVRLNKTDEEYSLLRTTVVKALHDLQSNGYALFDKTKTCRQCALLY
jgi:hypothetical protein